MAKKRADVCIVNKGLASSREKAQELISQGIVLADGKPVSKASSLIDEHCYISLLENKNTSFVSRGGLKLEKALQEFKIDPQGLNVIDIGASTGGFTDCLLRHGARAVTAVDVGYGQLAWSLRNDPRVTVMERTNIRNVSPDDFEELFNFATIDVSFISLEKILDAVAALLKCDDENKCVGENRGIVMALVKPQFEAGRERVGKKGVVRDAEVHRDVLSKVWGSFEHHGFLVKDLSYSPIKGPEGNIEFLLYASVFAGDSVVNEDEAVRDKNALIEAVVNEAHRLTQ